MTLEELWKRIKKYQGEPFQTKTGKVFHFEVSAASLKVLEVKGAIIPAKYFLLALDIVPTKTPKLFSDIYKDTFKIVPWGHNYIWAILHDKRIRQGDW